MTFVLMEAFNPNPGPEMNGFAQVMNGSGVPISVTEEGHQLLPGQIAAVSDSDQVLQKRLSRGQVILLWPVHDNGSGRKKASKGPKVRADSGDAAVHRRGENSKPNE